MERRVDRLICHQRDGCNPLDHPSLETLKTVGSTVFPATAGDSIGVAAPHGLRFGNSGSGDFLVVGLAHRPAAHSTQEYNGHPALSRVLSSAHWPAGAMVTRSAFGCGNGCCGLSDYKDGRIPWAASDWNSGEHRGCPQLTMTEDFRKGRSAHQGNAAPMLIRGGWRPHRQIVEIDSGPNPRGRRLLPTPGRRPPCCDRGRPCRPQPYLWPEKFAPANA